MCCILAHGANVHSYYGTSFSLFEIGSPAQVPFNLGGLVIDAADPNYLLIGGYANSEAATLYRVGVTRGPDGHITGLSGEVTQVAQAPHIDGGLAYTPTGSLIYTGYPRNAIYELRPGSTYPDNRTNLDWFLFPPSVGTLQFIPEGIANAGQLAIASYSSSQWFRVSTSVDGNGFYQFSDPLATVQLQYKPEGIFFVPPGSPLFPNPTVLISEYQGGSIVAYDLNENGDPIPETRRIFAEGFSAIVGAARDPVTSDLLFVQYGGSDRIHRISGFAEIESVHSPEPGTLLMVGAGLILFASLPRVSTWLK